MIETLCANNVPDTSKIIFLINPFEDSILLVIFINHFSISS